MGDVELLTSLMGHYVRAKGTGQKEIADEMLTNITSLWINMTTMNYFMDLEKHQGCSDGDDCVFYKDMVDHLNGLMAAIEKDLHLAIQVNMKLANVKFPGWKPIVEITEEVLQKMAENGHALNTTPMGVDTMELSKEELVQVLRGKLNRKTLTEMVAQASDPDPKKLN